MFVNFAQILTHNPLWVDFNTCLFCYFFQVGIHFSKWSKCSYIDGKLLQTPKEEFLYSWLGYNAFAKVGLQAKLNGGSRR